ncbi:MAG: DNA recombination protein RmuC [bacterium]
MSVIIVALIVGIAAGCGAALIVRGSRREVSETDLRLALTEKLHQIGSELGESNRASREELQRSLSELRGQVTGELTTGRAEQRDVLEKTARVLEEKFDKLQASSEQKLGDIQGRVEQKLTETLDRTSQTFKEVTDRLSDLRVTNERIVEFSRDLNRLNDILQSPKLRGEFGELTLEKMLRECLAPDQYALQFGLGNEKADAVILSRQGHLAIDSKFPLENWRKARNAELSQEERDRASRDFGRDVRKHIEDIARKYIRPPTTLDFAVMFIPADSVYYELLQQADVLEQARQRRVFPASPTTFWALLQVTVIGFRGMKISEEAQKIAALLDGLRRDLDKFRDAFQKAQKQIGFARDNMEDAGKHLEHFGVTLDTLRLPGAGNGGDEVSDSLAEPRS